jgi:DNA-binding response OmpR family regulator
MHAEPKILLITDDPTLLDSLKKQLAEKYFGVSTATDTKEAVMAVYTDQPDLMILDVRVSSHGGLELCRWLRQETQIPIMLLGTSEDSMDKVIGLELGADDYLTLPFGQREFMARVKAIIRRAQWLRKEIVKANGKIVVNLGEAEQFHFDDLVIDLNRHEVRYRGAPAHLKPKEFDLLVFLARNRGTALARDLIIKRIWGEDYDPTSRTLDMHIRTLREKFEKDPANPTRLINVRGVGYRFDG